MYQYTININVSYGYGLKYWDTKNEPVSTRYGIQNLTVWPMAVCHKICAFVFYPLVPLSVPVYRCFLMFYMRRLLHQKQQLHRFVVPENRNMFQNILIDYSLNLFFQTWTLFRTNFYNLFQKSFIETWFPFKLLIYMWHQPKLTMHFEGNFAQKLP